MKRFLVWCGAPLRCKLGYHDDILDVPVSGHTMRLECTSCLRVTNGWTV